MSLNKTCLAYDDTMSIALASPCEACSASKTEKQSFFQDNMLHGALGVERVANFVSLVFSAIWVNLVFV